MMADTLPGLIPKRHTCSTERLVFHTDGEGGAYACPVCIRMWLDKTWTDMPAVHKNGYVCTVWIAWVDAHYPKLSSWARIRNSGVFWCDALAFEEFRLAISRAQKQPAPEPVDVEVHGVKLRIALVPDATATELLEARKELGEAYHVIGDLLDIVRRHEPPADQQPSWQVAALNRATEWRANREKLWEEREK